ncbi:TetR/AcrR family transcriptional regulator [Streptomyces sp. NPDC005498]|uniref:TetR/AcrR family transcriptional regulator n=1 Tax=Streptomyces sp. NPDC005498 TaxID=3364717 RepID=UPI0036906D3E
MPEDHSTAPVPRQRPKDRKNQIAQNASRLFVSNGFHAVRMEDIASASGITVRALYRHYAHKKALLSHVVNAGQARYLQAIQHSAPADPEAPVTLDDLLRRLAQAALDSIDLTLLWQREARYLDPDDHDRVRRALAGIAADISAAIQAHRPDLSPNAVELRAWTVLGVLAAPGQYRVSLRRPEFDQLLHAACRAAADAPTAPPPPTPSQTPRMPSSRREELLASAAHSFRRQGFAAAGIDDIGSGPGIAGPALYRYFDSKAEILTTLVLRLEEWFALETFRALRSAPSDAEVLRGLVSAYVRVVLEAPDLVAVAVTETLHLPPAARERLQRLRNDREAEWTRWLGTHRPDLPEGIGRVLAAVAASVVDDMVRAPRSLDVAATADDLVETVMAILLKTPAPPVQGSGSAQT